MRAAASSLARKAELDAAVLKAAITNAALGLLPETLSTSAVIPPRMQLVYRLGEANGLELDHGHIKGFLATVLVGLTSPCVDREFGPCGQTLIRQRPHLDH